MFLYGMAYTYYNLCNKKYMCIIRHLSATQALARVRVALPRGLACHVASTWARAKNARFFAIFFIDLDT